ncbi:DUF3027 domain-containing protein [Schumannella luteola]
MPEQQNIDIARAALLEMTPEATIGDLLVDRVEEDGTITVAFASALAGYPGWAWTVSLAHLDGLEPTVLEAELIPGDGALLAPDWVPWADRLAEYKAAQEAAEAEAAAAAAAGDGDAAGDEETADLDEDDLDDDDLDEEDLDEEVDDEDLLGSDVLHGGDLDGVDIDDLDEDSDDDDEAERSY